MARPKGSPKFGGRPKGGRNKVTVELRTMIEGALSDVGGQAYLVLQAHENPKAFLALVGKLIPRDLNVSGEIRHTLEDLIANAVQREAAAIPAETLQ